MRQAVGAVMFEPGLKRDWSCGLVAVAGVVLSLGTGCGGRPVVGHDGGLARDGAVDARDAATATDGGDAGPAPDSGPDGRAPVGSPCMMNSECHSFQCLTDEIAYQLLLHDVHTYGGYCILFPCNPGLHDADCGPGAHCFDGQPWGADMFICLKACYSPADCTRPQYVCLGTPTADGGAPIGACVPGDLFLQDGGA
jgi:hypothetical protein